MQNKKTYIICFFLILTFNSCQKKEDSYKNISDKYLKSLSTRNGYYVDVVVPVGTDKFVVFNTTTLLYIYTQYYQSKYFTDFEFLKALYNDSIKDIGQYLLDYATENVNEDVMGEYERYGLKYIIEKYLIKKGDYYTFKEKINFTVVKIMFINNYYLYYDDHIPTFNFKLKLENLEIPEV